MSKSKLVAFLLGCTLIACNGSRTVKGQLDETQFSLDEAQVLAISADGRSWRAPIRTDGVFDIALPAENTYTIRFANSTNMADVYDAFAVLEFPTNSGDSHRNFRLTAGDTIDLGIVQRDGVRTQMLDVDEDGVDDDTDSDIDTAGGWLDPRALTCDFSGGRDLVPVISQHNLLANVDTDDDGVSDDEDTDDCDSDGDSDSESDSDVDSDSEAELVCEDAAGGAEDRCDEQTPETSPMPSPGAGGL